MAKTYDVKYYQSADDMMYFEMQVEANSEAEAILAAKAMLGPDSRIESASERNY